MAFLTLNGVTFQIQEPGIREVLKRIGSVERSFDGSLLSTIRTTPLEWTFRTTPIPSTEALAVYQWLLGTGHSFNFDDATTYGYSNGKGLGTTTEEANVSNIVTNPKFGARHMRITADTPADYMDWAMGLGSDWTAFVWRDDGGGYDHYMETGSGLYFTDGLATAQEAWFSKESDGSFRLKGDTAGTIDFDDLVVVPYDIPASWAPQIYAQHAAAWSALPAMAIGGDGPLAAFTVELLEDIDANYRSYYDGTASAWENAGREFAFRMGTV